MAIESSVGRRNGRDSRNRIADQKTVQDLLNRIPASAGGGGQALRERMVEGMCSDGLYAAILRFQRKNLPKFADGRIDPEGPTIELLLKMVGADEAKATAAALAAAGWEVSQAKARQAAADDAQRRATWARLTASVEAMLFNPYRDVALRYLQATAGADPTRAPVLPGDIVLFGRMHLNGKGFPEPTGDDAWEARMTWSGPRVVRPRSYYKTFSGLAVSPTIRIEVDEGDRGIVLLKDGSAVNLLEKTTIAFFGDRVAQKPVLRTSGERAKLRENLRRLDGRR